MAFEGNSGSSQRVHEATEELCAVCIRMAFETSASKGNNAVQSDAISRAVDADTRGTLQMGRSQVTISVSH